MPNAILKAGPFASSSSSFLNEPNPLVYHGIDLNEAVPVNCASAFPFRSYISKEFFGLGNNANIQLKESGSELINASNENQQFSHILFAMFRYQAAIDFDVKLNYVISASATDATVSYLVTKKIGTNDEEEIEKVTSHSLGSSGPINSDQEVVISLAASVVPRFVGFKINFTVFGNPRPQDLTSDTSLILKTN